MTAEPAEPADPAPASGHDARRITLADARHVAMLARLALSDCELELIVDQLGAVLEHASDLTALDIEGVLPTAHPVPVGNVLREDEPRPTLARDHALAGAPDADSGRFSVPPP